MGGPNLNSGIVLVLFIILVIISRTFRNPAIANPLSMKGTCGVNQTPLDTYNKNVMKYTTQSMLHGPIGTCVIKTIDDKCHCWDNVSEDTCDDTVFKYQMANNYKGHNFNQVLKCKDISNPTKCEIKN